LLSSLRLEKENEFEFGENKIKVSMTAFLTFAYWLLSFAFYAICSCLHIWKNKISIKPTSLSCDTDNINECSICESVKSTHDMVIFKIVKL
jgi:hypothetical protein